LIRRSRERILTPMADQSSTDPIRRAAPGGDRALSREKPDETDYDHQHFVNLVAAAFLLVISIAIAWSIKAMEDYEKQRQCLDSGRRECVQLDARRHFGIRPPVR
jgi:hypothetical protein